MRRFSKLTIVCAGWMGALALVGCESGTGVPLVAVETRLLPIAEADAPDALGHGSAGEWRVELDDAHVLVGPVYLHAPPSTPLLAHLRSLFVSTAHAHAGDDNLDGVRVLGEVLDPLAFDALDADGATFGPMLAEAAPLDRVVLVLDEPRGEHASPTGPTHGHHAWVSGRAVRGDDEVRFSAGLDVVDDRIARRVEGVRFASPPTLVEGARIVVRSRPGRWLSRVDFDALLAADHEGEVAAPSQLHHAWYLALRDPSSWELALETP